MKTLPAEIKDKTISYLCWEDLLIIGRVSSDLRFLVVPHLWKRIDKQKIGLKGMLDGMINEISPSTKPVQVRTPIYNVPTSYSLDLQKVTPYYRQFHSIRELLVDCVFAFTLMRRGELDTKRMRAFRFNWAAVEHDAAWNTGAYAVELPLLTDLVVYLDDYREYEFVIGGFCVQSRMMDAISGIARCAPLLRNLKLENSLVCATINTAAALIQLQTLDLSDAVLCDAHNLDVFRSLENMPNLKNLVLPTRRSSNMLGVSGSPIQPPVLRSLCVPGDHALVNMVMSGFRNPSISDLKINSIRLTNDYRLPMNIMSYSGLKSIHININQGNIWSITMAAIVKRLGSMPNLTSCRLFFQQEADHNMLTREDAIHIRHIWPRLCVLGLSMVDLGFFLEILKLQQLSELQVDAGLWDVQCWEGVSKKKYPGISSLHFSSSPRFWREEGAIEEICTRFPRLKNLVIAKGSTVKDCPCPCCEESVSEGSDYACEDDDSVEG